MKYYLIDGQYKSWDYLHNSLGYTTSATEGVSYNSVINWGSDAGNGYCTDTDDVEAEYFVSGVVGWYNINQLALAVHLYPSDVEDFTVEKNGVVSNAVRMNLDGTEYWLIEEEVKGENPYGWMARSVAEQEGWHEYEDVTYDFILVDSTTGRITYGVESLTEIEFTPTGYLTIDEGNEVVFVEQSPFPIVCIDEGTRTPESIAPDDSFDTELPYYASKLYIVTTDDGHDETLYGWEAEEGTQPQTTTVIAWLWLSQYGDNNFNINTGESLAVYTRGDGLRLPYISGYTYELIDLFYDYRDTVVARNVDATKFHLGDDGYGVRVYNDSAGLVYTVGATQVRITGTNIIVAFFTSDGSSATGDLYIESGIVKTLYDEYGTPIPYDSGSTYQTLNILNYAGDENRTATFGDYLSTSDSVLKGYSNGSILAYKLFILKS